jgi:dTDP-4-dehydrorhamnose reductase
MQTWLVTGAQGFLGANAGIFLGSMARTVGVARAGGTPAHYHSGVQGDLSEPVGLCAAIRELRPDVILHAAALASHEQCQSDPQLAERVNADATRQLAHAAADAGAQFVYISTDAVFDGSRGDYSEEDATAPFSVYGRTKLLGEEYALRETDALVVRTNFFGWSPSGSRSILEFFVNELSAGRPVNGYIDFTVTSTYAPILIDAIWRLVGDGAAGIVNVASSDKLSKYDFGRSVAEGFGLEASLISPVSATSARHATPRARDLSLRTDRLRDLLGVEAPTQQVGILQARDDSPTLRQVLSEGGTST